MRTALPLIVFLSLLYASPAAAECPGPYYECDIEFNTSSEENCLKLDHYEYGTRSKSCLVVAKNTCNGGMIFVTTQDGKEEPLSSDEPLPVLLFDPEEAAPKTESIMWRSMSDGVENSGTLTATLISKELIDDDCDDNPFLVCAATLPQRPVAPLTALLPMLLGALLWRRRSTSSRRDI